MSLPFGCVQIQKANRVLVIDESEIEAYRSMGFSVIGNDGTIILDAVPTDIPSYAAALDRANAKVKELEAEVTKLKEQLAKKPRATTQAKKEKES